MKEYVAGNLREKNNYERKILRRKTYLSWTHFSKISFQGKYSKLENTKSGKILLEKGELLMGCLCTKVLEKRKDDEVKNCFGGKQK